MLAYAQGAADVGTAQGSTRAKALPINAHLAADAATAAELLSRCIATTPGASQRRLAARQGVQRGTAAKWCLPQHHQSPSLARVVRMARVDRQLFAALVRELALLVDAGCGAPVCHVTLMGHAALVSHESAEVMGQVHQAMLDGDLSDGDLERVDRELADVQRVVAAARGELRRRL
jgi:hypothetical protein